MIVLIFFSLSGNMKQTVRRGYPALYHSILLFFILSKATYTVTNQAYFAWICSYYASTHVSNHHLLFWFYSFCLSFYVLTSYLEIHGSDWKCVNFTYKINIIGITRRQNKEQSALCSLLLPSYYSNNFAGKINTFLIRSMFL